MKRYECEEIEVLTRALKELTEAYRLCRSSASAAVAMMAAAKVLARKIKEASA